MKFNKIGHHPIVKTEFFETNKTNQCIWCKKRSKKNIAHILSKKLLETDHKDNRLKISVCVDCNSYFGNEIENWLFKYTPLGFWKDQISSKRTKLKYSKALQFVPNFVYLEFFKEWIVVNHADKGDLFPTQLFALKDGNFKLFLRDLNDHVPVGEIIRGFSESAEKVTYSLYISELLNDDFHPRLFFYKREYILIAKSTADMDYYLRCIRTISLSKTESIIIKHNIGKIQKMHIHYKWSLTKYSSYTAKIAFEYLSLFKGSDFILNKHFDSVRQLIRLKPIKDDTKHILYEDGKGFKVNRLTFNGWVSFNKEVEMVLGKVIPPYFLKDDSKFTHSIVIYQYDNYICATVSLFGIERSAIVLGQLPTDIGGIYVITYSAQLDKLSFYHSGTSVSEYDETICIPFN